jgi:glutamyl-tRNA synthetase
VYQLAVVIDDGLSGITEVVRGCDLLSSAPRQMYLQELFGFQHPTYGHVPLLVAPDGRRLSKRDRDLDLGYLQQHTTAEKILGTLAHACGLIGKPESISARELTGEFDWNKLKREPICPDVSSLIE